MTVLCRAYSTDADARRAVDALPGAGVLAGALRVLTGEPERDGRTEAEGEFAA